NQQPTVVKADLNTEDSEKFYLGLHVLKYQISDPRSETEIRQFQLRSRCALASQKRADGRPYLDENQDKSEPEPAGQLHGDHPRFVIHAHSLPINQKPCNGATNHTH